MALTLTTVEQHLRSGAGQEAALLTLYMGAAWDYVRAFTNREWADPVPASVEAAVLLLVADLYENREATGPVKLHENKAVERLLWPHRVF